MRNSHNLDEPLPVISFLFHRSYEVVHFSDKLKPLCNGPFTNIDKHTEVTFKLPTRNAKAFHTHRNHSTPFYFENFCFLLRFNPKMNKMLK